MGDVYVQPKHKQSVGMITFKKEKKLFLSEFNDIVPFHVAGPQNKKGNCLT